MFHYIFDFKIVKTKHFYNQSRQELWTPTGLVTSIITHCTVRRNAWSNLDNTDLAMSAGTLCKVSTPVIVPFVEDNTQSTCATAILILPGFMCAAPSLFPFISTFLSSFQLNRIKYIVAWNARARRPACKNGATQFSTYLLGEKNVFIDGYYSWLLSSN